MTANNGIITLNDFDDSTVIVRNVITKKMKKNIKDKRKRNNKEVSLHLFDKEYIEKLYSLEIPRVDNARTSYDIFKSVMVNAAKVLMK
jgi:hypothetical protein